MIGVSNTNTTQQAAHVDTAKLPSDAGEGEIIAIIRAIPRQNRREVLAALQALVCVDTTHTEKVSYDA